MQVLVRDNNVDQALRVLKKKMQREGLFREMKESAPMRSRPNGASGKRRRQSVGTARPHARRCSVKGCLPGQKELPPPVSGHSQPAPSFGCYIP